MKFHIKFGKSEIQTIDYDSGLCNFTEAFIEALLQLEVLAKTLYKNKRKENPKLFKDQGIAIMIFHKKIYTHF